MALAARSLRAFPSRSRVIPARLHRVSWGVIFLLAVSAQAASIFHPLAKKTPFERAQHLQGVLASHPESQRTRGDYEQVLNAYRSIYHGDPASPKADASVDAVAGLLAEEGRIFGDEKLLQAALGQYEFLRTQYPASRYRFSALMAEGDIYRNDLNDRAAAKQRFQQFLLSYPSNPLADQARDELSEIHKEERPRQSRQVKDAQPSKRAVRSPVFSAANGSQQTPTAISEPATAPPASPHATRSAQSPPPVTAPVTIAASSLPETGLQKQNLQGQNFQGQNFQEQSLPGASASPPLHPGRVALVGGIRHWSTPVYTRIAIDLGDEVAYEAARVPGPDRIYFDLHGVRLDSRLNGQSVEVIDDGFLKRIRAAQFSNNITRIVLDVSSVSDYSAFLLPNPWRLIIDVHGRKPGTAQTTNQASNPPATTVPSTSIPAIQSAPGKTPVATLRPPLSAHQS